MLPDPLGSALLYAGVLGLAAGCLALLRPLRWLGLGTRRRGAALAAAGLLVVVAAVLLPARERRVTSAHTRLDDFVPVWEFAERHERRVAAPCSEVFAALRAVTAEEIRLFRLLTWIRQPRLPGRRVPETILAPPAAEPILEVAVRGGFVLLAEEPPRELLVGALVVRPPGPPAGKLDPAAFRDLAAPGHAKAGMTFLLAEEPGGCRLATETRVHATDPAARRRFAVYWRVIYPGSATIRRQWLAAIERRAVTGSPESPRIR